MKRIFLLFCFGMIISVWGCDERKSTPVGSGVIDRDDWGQFCETTLRPALRDTSYHTEVPTNAGPHLLVGEWSGYQTKSLLKFEALPESVLVTSATVRLLTSGIVDTATPFQPFIPESTFILISLLDTDWSGSDVTFETPFNGTPIETLAVGRSRDDSVTIHIPTEVVQDWIDGTRENNGLLLSFAEEPLTSSGEGFITMFYSTNTETQWPLLNISWSATDTSDTTIAGPTADVFIANRQNQWPFDTEPTRLMVGNGYIYRSLLQFNIQDSIPDEATVVQALLTLFIDHEYSFFDAMDVGIYRVTGSNWTDPEFDWNQITWTTLTSEEDSVVFNVQAVVQDWVAGETPNYGFLVKSLHEDWDVSSFVFHSSESQPHQRPRLDVAYTTPPEFGSKRGERERHVSQ